MDTLIKAGDPAPNFTLSDLDGQMHSLQEQKGKIVVINFWSAECPHSKRADELILPKLESWGEDVVLFSIASNANEEVSLLKQEAQARGLPFLLHDADQQAARAYDALTTPHIFVVDREGILRYQGALDDVTFRQLQPTRNYLFEAVEALLAGQDPDPSEHPPYGCTVVYYAE